MDGDSGAFGAVGAVPGYLLAYCLCYCECYNVSLVTASWRLACFFVFNCVTEYQPHML